jgi:DNA gyrase subunit A
MRLRQLTGLEDKLRAEYDEIMKLIEHLRALLADVNLRTALIKEELEEFGR